MRGDHTYDFSGDWKDARYLDGETVVNVKCRHCIGCNLRKQAEWSVRAFHEAQIHNAHWTDEETNITTEIANNTVITLTYDDAHLPMTHITEQGKEHHSPTGFLLHHDFQKFLKRLRHWRTRKLGLTEKVAYLMCGEYGGKTHRPHYHAVIFNHTFADPYTETTGQTMSQELDWLWSQPAPGDYYPTKIGRATIDTYSYAGGAYVAGYVAKKSVLKGHQGPTADITDEHGTRRIIPLRPEYQKSSTHPGLGADWIRIPSNMKEIYSQDKVRISNFTYPVPNYYDKIMLAERPDLFGDIKANRLAKVGETSKEWTPDRCAAAEKICLDKLQQRRDSL